jgi:hypothetical protein
MGPKWRGGALASKTGADRLLERPEQRPPNLGRGGFEQTAGVGV